MEKVIIEIFSDYVWPFCWLAESAVYELVKSELNIEIIWRAFELRSEPVPTLPPDGEYLHRVWNASVYPMAESLGITILDLETNSLRGALEIREFEPSVLADEQETEIIGLSGVPAFVANRKMALSGVQPLENLKNLVKRTRAL